MARRIIHPKRAFLAQAASREAWTSEEEAALDMAKQIILDASPISRMEWDGLASGTMRVVPADFGNATRH